MSEQSADTSGTTSVRYPVLVYTLARFGLVLVVGAVFYLLGLRDVPLILAAFLVSAIVSYVLLARTRGAAAQQVGGYFTRLNQRIEASTTAEDEAVASVTVQQVDLSDQTEAVNKRDV